MSLSLRDRRALLVGGIALSALLLLARGIPAYRHWLWHEQENAMHAAREKVRAQALVAAAPEVRDSLSRRAKQLLGLSTRILAGESRASAGAGLAALLSGMAAGSNVKLGTVHILTDSAATGAFTRVGVRADATGDIRGITALLAAFERGPALLSVSELSITQPDMAAPDNRAEMLHLELLVEGLALNRGNGAPAR